MHVLIQRRRVGPEICDPHQLPGAAALRTTYEHKALLFHQGQVQGLEFRATAKQGGNGV